jgi:hypothetical protein
MLARSISATLEAWLRVNSRTLIVSGPNFSRWARVTSGPRSRAHCAVDRDSRRNLRGLVPTTYSSARRSGAVDQVVESPDALAEKDGGCQHFGSESSILGYRRCSSGVAAVQFLLEVPNEPVEVAEERNELSKSRTGGLEGSISFSRAAWEIGNRSR